MKLGTVEGGRVPDSEHGGGSALDARLDAAVDGMLTIARRETLALAAALQSTDADGSVLASGRLRWALACAQQFAARSPAALMRVRPSLVAILEAADRWLPGGPTQELNPERMQRLLGQLREPGIDLRAICADDSLIVAFDLDELPLSGMSLRGATVAHVTARHARLEAMRASKAKIARTDFTAAALRMSTFDRAGLEDCNISRANLEASSWREASLTRCVAVGAVFFNADLEGAQFVDCDLRDTDFQGDPETTMRGARFIRCDLRESNWGGRSLAGVAFVGCKMYGAHGRAGGLDATEVEQVDLSHGGDGTRVAGKNELLESWQEDAWTI